MPNLFSALPVAILAWVLASTSGLTRSETCGGAALLLRDRGQQLELRLGLHVDAEDALVDRERELARGLADAREHDLVRRNAGRAGALELALRDHVGAGAEPGQRLDHRLVRVRLHGVADQRAHIREGMREHLVVPLERGGGIAIERRADRRRQRRRDRPPRRAARRPDRRSGASPAGSVNQPIEERISVFRRAAPPACRPVAGAAPGCAVGSGRSPAAAIGGGSSPALRPQPASASAAASAASAANPARPRPIGIDVTTSGASRAWRLDHPATS